MATSEGARIEAVGDLTEDIIANIRGLPEAIKLLRKLKLDSKRLKTLDDAQIRLRQQLQRSQDVTDSASDEDNVLNNILQKHVVSRGKLLDLYRGVKRCIECMPDGRKQDLRSHVPNLDVKMEENMRELEDKGSECGILIAGETSSGKTSLLNLLLGEDLLPTSTLSCTSALCELKYGAKKRVVAYPWDPSDGERLERDLEGPDINVKEVLAPFVHQQNTERGKVFQYKRVEIFWPFELLKGGIYIIDSPGVGETKDLTDMVKEHLHKAFAFIYVINSGNAGGVQHDRLQDLLAEFSKPTPDRQELDFFKFNPESAIFVCNKWDQVPINEVDAVKQDTLAKLKKCWNGLKDSQVFYLSTTKAIAAKRAGVINADFDQLLGGIKALLPISLNTKLEMKYRWAAHVLKRLNFTIRVLLANQQRSEEDRNAHWEKIRNQLKKLQNESDTILKSLEDEVKQKVQEIYEELKDHFLNGKDVRKRITTWGILDCPVALGDWDDLTARVTLCVSKRMREEIEEWDSEGQKFKSIEKQLMESFRTKFAIMDHQVTMIERAMLETDGSSTGSLDGSQLLNLERSQAGFSTTEKVAIAVSSPVWIPLGLAASVVLVPVLVGYLIAQNKKEKKLLQQYNDDPCKVMKDLAEKLYCRFLDKDVLKEVVRHLLKNITRTHQTLVDSIPQIIQANRDVVDNMENEITQSDTQWDQYVDFGNAVLVQEGRLHMCYVNDIRNFDIDVKDLRRVDDFQLAEGSYGCVQKMEWRQNKSSDAMMVAVKYNKSPLSPNTAAEILLEEDNLRQFKHPNIVKYYGTALFKQGGDKHPDKRLYMVMEFCQTNLARILFKRPEITPGKQTPGTHEMRVALTKTAKFMEELCAGLAYIHYYGFVHRDLKPENILVTENEHIKLADVGVTKRVDDITGTVVGTPQYIAPEVWASDDYNRTADMYSFGVILWEAWFGIRVSESREFNKNYARLGGSPQAIESMTRKGWRPPMHMKDMIDPIGEWRTMIETCLHTKPEERLSAEECRKMFASSAVIDCYKDMIAFETVC